jgi:hypothetical protein
VVGDLRDLVERGLDDSQSISATLFGGNLDLAAAFTSDRAGISLLGS